MGVETGPIQPLLLPLLAQDPPPLLFCGEVLQFFPGLILDLLLFEFSAGDLELQLLAVLLLLRGSALVDGDHCAQFGNAPIELGVFVLYPHQALVEIGLLPQ